MAPRRAFVIGFVRTPPSAQSLHPLVGNPLRFQRGAERLGTELRVAPRTRKAPDVDHCLDAVRMEKAQELGKPERGVADCPELALRGSDLDIDMDCVHALTGAP